MPASSLVEDVVAALVNSRGFVGISLCANEIAFARRLPSAILDLGLGCAKLAGFATLVHGEEALVRTPADLLPAIERVLSGTPPWNGLGEIAGRIDAHFDALAELAERSATRRLDSSPSAPRPLAAGMLLDGPEDATASMRAFEARGRRLVEQRLRLGTEIERLEQDRSRQAKEIEHSNQELRAKEQELRAKEQELRAKEQELRAKEQELRAKEQLFTEERLCYADEIDRLSCALQDLLNSKSIRYTAPLRAFLGPLLRLRK
jgi:hypothetical protein